MALFPQSKEQLRFAMSKAIARAPRRGFIGSERGDGRLICVLGPKGGTGKTLTSTNLAVALALPEDGRLLCCDVSREWTAIARTFWDEAGVGEKIDLRIAPASETLDRLLEDGEADAYDFAFVDADKTDLEAYLAQALRLLRTGGVLAVDNALWSGKVADPAQRDEETVTIRDLGRTILEHEALVPVLLPVGDGLLAAKKEWAPEA